MGELLQQKHPFVAFFRQHKVSEVVPPNQRVFSVTIQDTLEHAVTLLSKSKVLSLPVMGPGGPSPIGLIDMLDIASYLAQIAAQPETPESHIRMQDFRTYQAMNYSGRNELHTVNETASAENALEVLSKGIHRLIVLDSSGQLSGILSQMDMCRFLWEHLQTSQLQDFASRLTMSDVGFSYLFGGRVVADKAPLREAINLLKNHGGALPVTNHEGKLVANFSASDLTGIFEAEIPSFTQTVMEYLQMHGAPHSKSLNPIVISTDATLGEMMYFFITHHIHHLWVVNQRRQPIGHVSLTDCLSMLGKATNRPPPVPGAPQATLAIG
eukprot:TRINITY_DN750_c0_g2_i1.p1 TRINITY_DN750_c0_g2~~TRINITY_DN750_c0_g2_i1.p1  ORF type:complete len:335 (-),score=41.84 TRINITY_DN750_c0_g2_i1:66-1040(-)